MRDFFLQFGYLGVFLINLIGVSAIIFPAFWAVVIFTLGGGVISFAPLLTALALGLESDKEGSA
jgi:hypothetical protein